MGDINLDATGLIELLDASLHDKACQVDVDNAGLHELIRRQAVHGLVAEYMIEHSRDSATVQYYSEILGRGLRKFHIFMSEQEKISHSLSEAGIPHAILKGVAVAIYYPKPENRSNGDIDLLVGPERFREAEDILQQCGYTREAESLNPRHVSFKSSRDIKIELHRKFSSSYDETENERLDQRLFAALSIESNAECEGYSFAMLPTMENGLILLAHINQHLRGGIGFRQIVDWMVYVEHELSDEAWQNHFRQMAKEIGMETLAITVTQLCKQYLGMCADITWCASADPQLVDELLEYIIRSGNLGKGRTYEKKRTSDVLRSFSNPVTAYRRLQSNGLRKWKAAREHRFLRPFAWVYQIGRTIRLSFARKADLQDLRDEYTQSRREIRLLKKLGVTR